MHGRGVLRIGHRGAAGHAPENTLAAVAAGLALGVDLIEVDVQSTRDGALVIMHDKRVDRTTDGAGTVGELTLAEIRSLRAGNGDPVPTLDDVLRAVSGRAGMMIEIITPGIGAEVVRAVVASGFRGSVVYASFLHSELLAIRREDPRAATLALLEGVPVAATAFALDAQASHVGLSLDSTTPEFIAALKQAGLQVFLYTLNDPRDIDRARQLGVDGIISDYPDRVRV
jgi:glycerophosphoryl diester phosphodiesterase